jgi:transcriptional regulator with XRE-family HTH domain
MSKDCENHYKMSRGNAKLTQEQAVGLIEQYFLDVLSLERPIATRTLSDYENGHTRVPDDVVAAMADVYNCPLLAWWHLKNTSVLGKFLPDIQMPQTNSDMALQLWQAKRTLLPNAESLIDILCDEICSNKINDFKNKMEKIEQVKAMLVSVILYAKKITD